MTSAAATGPEYVVAALPTQRVSSPRLRQQWRLAPSAVDGVLRWETVGRRFPLYFEIPAAMFWASL